YEANDDWPDNNWYNDNRNPTDPLGLTSTRYFAWDGEVGWDRCVNGNVCNGAWVHPFFRNGATGNNAYITQIWRSVKRNKDFMMLMADRVYKHCFNGGALTDKNSQARWDTLTNYIRSAVVAESARWGDSLKNLIATTGTQQP